MFGQTYAVGFFMLLGFFCFSIEPSSQAVLERVFDPTFDLKNINKRYADQITEDVPCRVDTHHHILPSFYSQAVEAAGGDPAGGPNPPWSLEQDQAQMAALGIEFAFITVSAPGTKIYENDISPARGRSLARQINQYSADLCRNHSTQYGFFASLPSFTDVDGVLAEIAYCESTLKPDGYIVFTSYGHDFKYLGNSAFRTIWAKFNDLKTVVFVHPSLAPTTTVNRYLPEVLADYPQETTRTAADLVLTGTRRMFPDVKIILSHAGGTLPFLAYRISMAALSPALAVPLTQSEIVNNFQSFYFDTALSSYTPQLDALVAFANPSKLLFGSDDPFSPLSLQISISNTLDDYFLDKNRPKYKDLWKDLTFRNAKALFPNKLKKICKPQ